MPYFHISNEYYALKTLQLLFKLKILVILQEVEAISILLPYILAREKVPCRQERKTFANIWSESDPIKSREV